MGNNDPRLNSALKTDFCIGNMLVAWKIEDLPANNVNTIPILFIRHITYITQHLPAGAERLRATADMIIIAFFFLVRPGEYTDVPSNNTACIKK